MDIPTHTEDADSRSTSDSYDFHEEEAPSPTSNEEPIEMVTLNDAPVQTGRRIFCYASSQAHQHNANSKFANNSIHTTKYTWWSFIPKNLYEQFHRLANFYFLVIAFLMLVPSLTNLNPASSFAPLIFVLLVSAVKEAWEDWKRAKSDSELNHRKVLALRNGDFVEIEWRHVVVGDILKITNNSFIPADLVVLSSSLDAGICYIQTANLDGETNLKTKQALKQTSDLSTPSKLAEFRGVIECENPNKDMYNFDGRMWLDEKLRPDHVLSLNNSQVLLRGCLLKNTDWICAMVVFTGRETKLAQNSRPPPMKRTNLERLMNRSLISLFIFMLTVCIVCSIAATALQNYGDWYLSSVAASPWYQMFFFTLGSYITLFSYMIPISLYVSMELVKLCQVFFIDQDLHMYYEPTDTPAKAKTSNLNEELGQIDYIFSDKTGTLTCNEMELLRISVNGKAYSVSPNDEPEEELKSRATLLEAIKSDKEPDLLEFFKLLAVCHTVIPEVEGEGKEIVYQASSPDEYALVTAAANVGVVFKSRTFNTVTISALGKEETYEILNLIEFTSNRKRMTVICRTPDNKIRLYCKGADAILWPRMKKAPVNESTYSHLQLFAGGGLRTLCCAYADLDQKEYEEWDKKYIEANSDIKNRKKLVEEVAELIEQNMILLGATAIEDKLQDGVPETIAALRKGNIKIWVLTGDKQETAINIGLSSQLLTDVKLLTFDRANPDDPITPESTKLELDKALGELEGDQKKVQGDKPVEYGLVIEGEFLKYALEEALEPAFIKLALQCKCVICCRVTPAQKQAVVGRVKHNVKGARTLAIGDGANDVSMIQEAHVGIGIFGHEGMQAAMNSDYAIAQFKYLQNLLLVHGRWSYKRMARLVLYSFYKNITLSLCMFWFGIYTKYSAQNLFESWSLSAFNVVFTSIPIMVYSIFDKDINVPNSLATPKLYVEGQKNIEFGIKILWGWLAIGLWNSLVIFFGMLFYFGDSVIDFSGQSHGIWSFGVISYTVVIVVVNLKVAVETNYWTALSWISIVGSILVWFLFAITYSSICSASTEDMCHVAHRVYNAPTYWLLVIILAIICLIPDFTYKYWQRNYFPRPSQVAQEIQRASRKSRKQQKKFPMVKQEVSSVSLEQVKKVHFTGYAFSQEESGSISGALQASVAKLMQKSKRKSERIKVELELDHPEDTTRDYSPREGEATENRKSKERD